MIMRIELGADEQNDWVFFYLQRIYECTPSSFHPDGMYLGLADRERGYWETWWGRWGC